MVRRFVYTEVSSRFDSYVVYEQVVKGSTPFGGSQGLLDAVTVRRLALEDTAQWWATGFERQGN
jgi:hypothetical protein